MTSCSIVIPTHNRPDLLPRAVASALLACPLDGEVVVVDDRSVTPAKEVLEHVADTRLRVIRNSGQGGAAIVRNLGVASASGDVVFFLDDDDEMTEDYCRRILQPAGPAYCAQWGFSSTLVCQGDSRESNRLLVRRRLRHGVATASSRIRDLVCALSEGFWIEKQLFLACGGLDAELSIDEDTDLCVRLISLGALPWYEKPLGMVVYRGYAPSAGSAAQLTMSTPVTIGLRCYRRTHDKNCSAFGLHSAMRWFLATRYLRRAIKARQIDQAMDFVWAQRPWSVSSTLTVYVYAKRLWHW